MVIKETVNKSEIKEGKGKEERDKINITYISAIYLLVIYLPAIYLLVIPLSAVYRLSLY
jgi:hypothetical protein